MVERADFQSKYPGVFTTWKNGGRSPLGPRPLFSVRINSFVAALKAKGRAAEQAIVACPAFGGPAIVSQPFPPAGPAL
jgi:hypothetical protein